MDLGGLPVTVLDTAGLRETDDVVEGIGIARARSRAEAADLRVVLTLDGRNPGVDLREGDFLVRSKVDLSDGAEGISALTGRGISDLVDGIRGVLETRAALIGTATRERHQVAMHRAEERLGAALSLIEDGPTDLVAEELRSAVRALDSLVGRVDVEALLDEIFSSFCIGK